MTDRPVEHEIAAETARILKVVAVGLWQHRQRQAQRAAEVAREQSRNAAEIRRRLEAELRDLHHTHRRQWQRVRQPGWWDRATPGDVAVSWYAAAAWREEDTDAAEVADEISAELRSRYSIDLDTLYDHETVGLDGESYQAWFQADAAAMNESMRAANRLEPAVGDIDPRAQAVAEALRRSFPRPIRQEAAEWVARQTTPEGIDRHHQRVGRRADRPRGDTGR